MICDDLRIDIFERRVKNREECAVRYAEIIRIANHEGDLDVSRLNDAIILRWSRSALDFIKNRAWQIVDPGAARK